MQGSVADSHPFNADPDPTTHFLPDLDPQMHQSGPLRHPPFNFDADPNPAIYFDAAFQFDADPDPAAPNDPDP